MYMFNQVAHALLVSAFQPDDSHPGEGRQQAIDLALFQNYHVIHQIQRGHHFGAGGGAEHGLRRRREGHDDHRGWLAIALTGEFPGVRRQKNVEVAGDEHGRPGIARQRMRGVGPNDFASRVQMRLTDYRSMGTRTVPRPATIYLQFASKAGKLNIMPQRRSGCPVSIALETFGDRWSLLLIRDMMVRGYCTFKEFQQSGEGIATNVLAGRLRRLAAAGIISAEASPVDGRSLDYRLTEKGIGLAPMMLELLIWSARHEQTAAPCAVIDHMEQHRREVLAEVRRRWRDRDATPLLPKFQEEKS